MAGVGEVEHRPPAAGGGRGRGDQDGAGAAARLLPPTLHADEPSPHVDWSAGAVRLLAEAGAVAGRGGAAAAGGGVGVRDERHERARDPGRAPAAGRSRRPPQAGEGWPAGRAARLAWLVSARTADGLRAQAGRLAALLAARPELDPADVGWSLARTRSVFEHRAVVSGAGRDELVAGLAAVAAGEPAAGWCGRRMPAGAGRVVFVFPGQGAQWAGMGRELAAVLSGVRGAAGGVRSRRWPRTWAGRWRTCSRAPGAPGLEAAEVVQPVLWAVMVSLAAVWQAAGVVPDAVVGHSQGEIAAATVAGILSLQDAARVVAVRSRALSGLGARAGWCRW